MSPASIHIGTSTPKANVDTLKKNPQMEDSGSAIEKLNRLVGNLSSIKSRDKVIFFRLLSTMINAGISIVQALKILTEQTDNVHMKNIIGDIAFRIETGNKFSEALGEYPRYFTPAQVGMVEAGEASGRLNETLLQIATEAEKSASLKSKVKGAMIYPAVVIFLLMVAGFAVMTFVMPRIKELFENLGGELPASTKALIAFSDFLVASTAGVSNAVWTVLVLIGLVVAFILWTRTKVGGYLWSQFILQLPSFGKISQEFALARFMRTLSTLSASGVSIIKALRIAGDSVGNPVYERRIHRIADDVRQGITMGENMKDDEAHFPAMMVGMISVAEQTAQVGEISGRLADYYEDEVDTAVKNISSLIEPVIILVLGLAVGFLVISVMLPILQSSDLAFSST